MQAYRFPAPALNVLIEVMRGRGYRVVGPTPRDGAIVYDEIAGIDELPIGLTDEQEKGHYRLKKRDDSAYFGYNVGPQSPKKHLFPPNQTLWRTKRVEGKLRIEPASGEEDQRPLALLGVRACELAAIAIQDKVFTKGPFPNAGYARPCVAAHSRHWGTGLW